MKQVTNFTKPTRKNEIWYCYQLNEKVNELGNPYIGKAGNLKVRAEKWQKELELDYLPELHIIDVFDNEVDCYNFEQDRRVANGWSRERSLEQQIRMRVKGGEVTGRNNVESGKVKEMGKIGGKGRYKQMKETGEWLQVQKIGGSVSGKKQSEIIHTCPYCGKIGKGFTMRRWHFTNCKYKK